MAKRKTTESVSDVVQDAVSDDVLDANAMDEAGLIPDEPATDTESATEASAPEEAQDETPKPKAKTVIPAPSWGSAVGWGRYHA